MPEAEPYWEAFMLAHPTRPIGMSAPGRIPLSELLAALDLLGVPPGERLEYSQMVAAADGAWLSVIHKKAEANKPSKTPLSKKSIR